MPARPGGREMGSGEWKGGGRPMTGRGGAHNHKKTLYDLVFPVKGRISAIIRIEGMSGI